MEAAVAEAEAPTNAGMVSHMMRIEQFAEYTTANQKTHLLAEMNTVAQNRADTPKRYIGQSGNRRNGNFEMTLIQQLSRSSKQDKSRHVAAVKNVDDQSTQLLARPRTRVGSIFIGVISGEVSTGSNESST